MQLLKHLLFLCLTLSPAFATVPEIPADGVDNGTSSGTAGSCPAGYADAVYSVGCDLLLPGHDKDNDGYTDDGSLGWAGTTQTDCDDTNRTVYPGIHRKGSCTGSNYQTCQTSGSWNACQTGPLCEATGSGVCKYIDCGSGSNANTGTYASPYLTWGKVSGGSAGTPPASPYTLQPGDVVYLIGTGTCSTAFSSIVGGLAHDVIFEARSAGTASNRITLRRYPGVTALMTGTNTLPFAIFASYYTVDGFKGNTTYSSAFKTSFVYSRDASNLIISNLNVTGVAADGDYNNACVQFDHSSGNTVRNNYLGECKQATGNVDNIAAIGILDDSGLGEGANHASYGNTIYYASPSNTLNGSGIYGKHGVNFSETGANGHQFHHNYIVNARRVINWGSSGLRASRLFAYHDGPGFETSTSTQGVLLLSPLGGSNSHEDNRIEDSTFVNFSMVYWQEPTYGSALEKLTLDNVVIVDNATAYVAGNNEGIISIDPYGSDAQKTTLESGAGRLAINNNCYYNAGLTLNFSYFNMTSGGGGHGPAGNAGADYTFANWQTNTAPDQDLQSFVTNPTFDMYYRATVASCLDKGWLLTSEEAGAGVSGGGYACYW